MMFIFAVFVATTVLVVFFIGKRYLNTGKKKQILTTIPGPASMDSVLGNIPDINASGSLIEFLDHAHKIYGPIISFWLGQNMCVSIASAQLFQEHAHVFSRPIELFESLLILITNKSIQITNGAEGHRRYAAYAKCYTQSAVNRHYNIYNKFSEEVVKNWSAMPSDEHIPLQEQMTIFAIKTILLASFGEEFHDEKLCMDVRRHYDVCFKEIDRQMKGDLFEDGSSRARLFNEHKEAFFNVIRNAVNNRMENQSDKEGQTLIDAAIELGLPEETLLADLLTMFIGGFHTSASLMTWAMYYMSHYPDVQERARAEVMAVVGSQADVTPTMTDSLVYLQMVLKESIRTARIGLYSARCQEEDSILGGHNVPAMTPVIHALGVAIHDPAVFPEPERFNPERFSAVNEKSIRNFGFEPFGFAGKRKCPGYRFSLTETTVLLAFLLRSFRFSLVPNQNIVPEYGLIARARDEIWLIKRSL